MTRRQSCSNTVNAIGEKQYFRHGPYHLTIPICPLPSFGITAQRFDAGFGVIGSKVMNDSVVFESRRQISGASCESYSLPQVGHW